MSDSALLVGLALLSGLAGYGLAWLQGLTSEAPFNRGAKHVLDAITELGFGDDVVRAIEAKAREGGSDDR